MYWGIEGIVLEESLGTDGEFGFFGAKGLQDRW
jgi:hypothetical protein